MSKACQNNTYNIISIVNPDRGDIILWAGCPRYRFLPRRLSHPSDCRKWNQVAIYAICTLDLWEEPNRMMRLTCSPVRHFIVIGWFATADEYHCSAVDHILTQRLPSPDCTNPDKWKFSTSTTQYCWLESGPGCSEKRARGVSSVLLTTCLT